MRQRTFGRSGRPVSELVFGGGWVGGILIHPDEETRAAALERALSAGVTWIDTAPSYGDGESERALGRLLPGLDHDPDLSTKVRLDTARMDDVAGQVEASVAASYERLGRDRVLLMQLHNPIAAERGGGAVSVEDVLGAGGIADTFDALRAQGLFDLAGITALGEGAACRAVIESGRFDSAQVYYNAINPSSAWRSVPAGWSGQDFSGLLDACESHGVAAMCIRVLAAGVLATDERHGREVPVATGASMSREEARAAAVGALVGPDQGTRAEVAIRFGLAERRLSCVVVGMAELDHLEQALGAAERGPLPDDVLERLAALQRRDFEG